MYTQYLMTISQLDNIIHYTEMTDIWRELYIAVGCKLPVHYKSHPGLQMEHINCTERM